MVQFEHTLVRPGIPILEFPSVPAIPDGRLLDEQLGSEASERRLHGFEWVHKHRELMGEVITKGREEQREIPAGYVYERDGVWVSAGFVIPDLESEAASALPRYVEGTPIRTYWDPGARSKQDLPGSLAARSRFIQNELVTQRKIKKIVFTFGGWGENTLAIEGESVELAKELSQLGEDIAVVAISHSGSEFSAHVPRGGVDDFSDIDVVSQIDSSIKRVLEMYGLTEEDVVAVVGHSMGGLYARKVWEKMKYKNAAYVYKSPVIKGTDVKNNPRWLVESEASSAKEQHVLLHKGILGGLVDIAVKFPDTAIRDMAFVGLKGVKFLNWLGEHFIGKRAAFRDESLAVILTELWENPVSIKRIQRILKGMPVIADDEKIHWKSNNPQLVVIAGKDRTLGTAEQRAFAQKICDEEALRVSEETSESPHNLDKRSVVAVNRWLVKQIARKLGRG